MKRIIRWCRSCGAYFHNRERCGLCGVCGVPVPMPPKRGGIHD